MAGTREPETLAISGSSEEANRCDGDAAVLRAEGAAVRGGWAEAGMADAIRCLTLDAVAEAGSGACDLPLAMADAATALWCRQLRFDAADPRWPDRDRFVLSAGAGAMLLYSLLHLTGHAGMERDALRRFRQIDSPAAGMPEHGEHPAIEATTGPPGQGLATAVGLALAERMMAARFGRSLVDHRCWVVAGSGDLVRGVGHEAACLAGALRLERLTVLWHEDAELAEDVVRRFAAVGWTTKRVDGDAPGEIAAALALAVRSRKPTLIACRAAAGMRAPVEATGSFDVPDAVSEAWLRAGSRGTTARRAWLKRLANHPLRAEFERVTGGRLPESWHETTAALRAEWAESRPGGSTAESSRRVVEALLGAVPELAGGDSGDAAPAGMASITADSYAGRHVDHGGRAHAMAACSNGLALHGGVLPYAGGDLLGADSMRPALRLAAQMRQRVIHVLGRDGIGVGQDGPACQPVEQLAALRAMPGLHVMRPADALETVECWELAMRRADGPSALVLSDQAVPALRTDGVEARCARGGYVLAEADGPRGATLIASGSEVAIAMAARELLAAEGIPVAVVSLPCWELFAAQDESTRAMVLGTAPRVGIEAACGFGWERWLGADGIFIGMTGYGASAPPDTLYRHFGITPEAIVSAVRKRQPVSPSPTEGT